MIVGFYARVSTEEQRERQTIEAQVDYAKGRAALEGWELRLFLDDGVSGTLPLEQRPAGAELLRAAGAKEIVAVATYRLDRLGRTQLVILQAIDRLKKLGVSYRSLTEPFETGTPFGDAALGMVAVFAQLDRAVFLERSRAGTERVAKQDGRWLGGIVPYGYYKKADMTLGIDERPMAGTELSQADVIRQMFRWCAVDGWSSTRITDELNARRIPTTYVRDGREVMSGEIHGTRAAKDGKRKRRTSGKWSGSRVLSILHNELYAGTHHYGRRSFHGRDLIERAMPAIISPALFEQAQTRMRGNVQWLRNTPKRAYALRGLIRCECGHMLIGQSWRGKGGALYQVYKCVAHSGESRPCRVNAAEAERLMWGDVESFFADPNAVVRSVVRRLADAGAEEKRIERELTTLAQEARALEEQETRLLDASVRGLFQRSVVEARAKKLTAEKRAVERRMAGLRDERASTARAVEETATVKRFLAELRRRAKAATAEDRAELLRMLIRRARASWEGDRIRLDVGYAFIHGVSVAPIPSIDIGSGDRYNEPRLLERVHVMAEGGRWPTRPDVISTESTPWA